MRLQTDGVNPFCERSWGFEPGVQPVRFFRAGAGVFEDVEGRVSSSSVERGFGTPAMHWPAL